MPISIVVGGLGNLIVTGINSENFQIRFNSTRRLLRKTAFLSFVIFSELKVSFKRTLD